MDKAIFWKIIDASRKQGRGDLAAQLEVLRSRLEQLDPDEIVQFGRIFEEYHTKAYTWDLWVAAYLIGGGCSDDGFLDFRGWLISKGEKVFQRGVKIPSPSSWWSRMMKKTVSLKASSMRRRKHGSRRPGTACMTFRTTTGLSIGRNPRASDGVKMVTTSNGVCRNSGRSSGHNRCAGSA